jgi:SNF2 family DNA or RNA helicase
MSDSYEAYYQCIRRCWRFGQQHPVDVYVVVSEAEQVIVENVRRKEAASRSLSDQLVAEMRDFEREEVSV